MSDERETNANPGGPVEEQATSDTAVRDAVERAIQIPEDAERAVEGAVLEGSAGSGAEAVAAVDAAAEADPAAGADAAAEADPAAGASTVSGADATTATTAATVAETTIDAAAAEEAHRLEVSQLDTQLDLEKPTESTVVIADPTELPSAAADPETLLPPLAPERDGEIRISADHPMAALYMQSPMPPDLRGNRGAGVLIALLATIAFAVLAAGLVAIMVAPDVPPSKFFSEGLLPWVTSWGFIAGVVTFFLGLSVLVVVFGRAGWWAYVIFSLFVGVAVWGVTTGVYALAGSPLGTPTELAKEAGLKPGEWGTTLSLAKQYAFMLPTLGAGILAREVATWFGAWIGARGRRVTAKNAEMLEEYEAALAEARAS